MVDLLPGEAATRLRAAVKSGDGWRVAPNPIPPDTSAEDAKWIHALRLPQPVRTLETPVRLRHGDTKIRAQYAALLRIGAGDPFHAFAARAKAEHWDYRELDASHSAHVTAPQPLMRLLNSIVTV